MMVSSGRVLSIQSTVVSGYVGNKCAAFPLQLLGFDVDMINSVQFSNHTAYKNGWTGTTLNGDELLGLVDGLVRNNLAGQITHLLTGYIGSVSFLSAIIQVYKTLREHNPDLVYLCDPVMGDDGMFYVPRDLLEVYQQTVLPLAKIVTPNAFELGVLSGQADDWGSQPRSPQEVFDACNVLHGKGCETVIVTSSKADDSSVLRAYASRAVSADHKETYIFEIEGLSVEFTGSGDLTAALLLGHLTGQGSCKALAEACELAFSTTAEVLRRTYKLGRKGGLTNRPELELVASRDVILKPPATIRAQPWP